MEFIFDLSPLASTCTIFKFFCRYFVSLAPSSHFTHIAFLRFLCLFTLVHETETRTASDHITLNCICQDGISLQIVAQKGILDCISLYETQF